MPDRGGCGDSVPYSIKVVRLITGLEIGGAELGLLEQMRCFDRTRFHFTVGCLYNSGSVARQIEALGVKVVDMRMRWFGDPVGLLRLWLFLRNSRPDILHTHLFRANVWGRLVGHALKIPVVISSEHSLGREQIEGRRRNAFLAALDRWTARYCDRVIAVSKATRNYLIENGIPQDRVVVLHNSVETWRFTSEIPSDKLRAEFGLEKCKIVTIVARLHATKNHKLLIDAFAQVNQRYPNTKLLIVGTGPLERELKSYAASVAGGAAIFAGSRNDIPEIMAISDLVVLSSDNETFGRSLVEGMASGKPVIGTAVDGIPEVISDHVTGLLVPPNDASALADAISLLVADAKLAKEYGQAGRRRAANLFDVHCAVKRVESLYLALISAKKPEFGVPEGRIVH